MILLEKVNYLEKVHGNGVPYACSARAPKMVGSKGLEQVPSGAIIQ